MTQNYAAMIDHTLLKADATRDQIAKFVKRQKNTFLHLFVLTQLG